MAKPVLGTSIGAVVLVLEAAGCVPRGTAPAASSETSLTRAAARRADVSVVTVIADRPGGPVTAAGFVVTPDGRIATNLGVIRRALHLTIELADGTRFPVTDVWYADEGLDLAIVKATAKGLVPLPLADSGAVHPGDPVIAIGGPTPTSVRRPIARRSIKSTDDVGGRPLLRMSMPVPPEASGGPLLDEQGAVVGVITNDGGSDAVHAVPAEAVAQLLASRVSPLTPAELLATEPGIAKPAMEDRCDLEHAAPAVCTQRCRRGHGPSCVAYGYALQYGKGMAHDPQRAAELYRRACEIRDLMGCAYLGVLYRRGDGVPLEPARALALFQKACDGGSPAGCRGAGEMVLYGEGTAASSARARELLERACDGDYGDSCVEAADIARTERRLDRAAPLYERGCDRGDPNGCTRLGVMLLDGQLPRDPVRAALLFQRACDEDNVEGCAHLGRALLDGKGVPSNRARGLRLLAWACRSGWGASCQQQRADAPAERRGHRAREY